MDSTIVQSVQELRTKQQECIYEGQPHSAGTVTRSNHGSGFLFA
ncbi:hypothetical protein [Paenibacillus sp. FSL K6-1318]